MTETLTEYGFDMINFCQFINSKYNFQIVTDKLNNVRSVDDAISAIILYHILSERYRKLNSK